MGIIDDQSLACDRDLLFRVFMPKGLILQKDRLLVGFELAQS